MRCLTNGSLRRLPLPQHPGMTTGGLATVAKTPRRGYFKTWALKEGVLPTDHANGPFHELDLEELWKGIGRTRVRQHVNPLRREYQTPSGPIDWQAAYKDPSLPLVVDLGCGPGRFLMLLHKRRRDEAVAAAAQQGKGAPGTQQYNYLGMEIRKPLVERANDWTQRLGFQDQVHYVYSNATISLGTMMKGYPGPVDSFLIQFPDPHFKKRHRKRRIFQRELVHAVRDLLPPGGRLFLQSDVHMVASAMRNCFEYYAGDSFELAAEHREEDAVFFCDEPVEVQEEPAGAKETSGTGADREGGARAEGAAVQSTGTAESSGEETDEGEGEGEGAGRSREEDYDSMQSAWKEGGWLRLNPIGVPTEREHYVIQQGLPVYRVLLVRKAS